MWRRYVVIKGMDVRACVVRNDATRSKLFPVYNVEWREAEVVFVKLYEYCVECVNRVEIILKTMYWNFTCVYKNIWLVPCFWNCRDMDKSGNIYCSKDIKICLCWWRGVSCFVLFWNPFVENALTTRYTVWQFSETSSKCQINNKSFFHPSWCKYVGHTNTLYCKPKYNQPLNVPFKFHNIAKSLQFHLIKGTILQPKTTLPDKTFTFQLYFIYLYYFIL